MTRKRSEQEDVENALAARKQRRFWDPESLALAFALTFPAVVYSALRSYGVTLRIFLNPAVVVGCIVGTVVSMLVCRVFIRIFFGFMSPGQRRPNGRR